jgi:hypothetical protein
MKMRLAIQTMLHQTDVILMTMGTLPLRGPALKNQNSASTI